MQTSIEIIVSPITEVKDALIEAVKEHFIKDLDPTFIYPSINDDIDKYIGEFKENLYCVIEFPYVDKVYRDSYYSYYSSKHYSYPRDCIRVSLFDREIKPEQFLNPKKHGALQKSYLGFFVLRPITSALFGRSVINPKALEEDEFKICTCRVGALVYGVKLETHGFPHSSQDEETLKCAETTIWGLMEYFGHRYAEYKPTLPSKIHHALERFSYQRQLPSNGLTMDQISFALKTFGFGTSVYSKSSYGNQIYDIIDSYIESGIPVLIGLQNKDVGHVIIAVGKKYNEDFKWKDIRKVRLPISGKKKWSYYDSCKIPNKYVVQDDNHVPYRVISLDNPGEHYLGDEDFENYKIDSVVVPLYPKIYLETVVAKQLALEIVKNPILGYKFGDDVVLRFNLNSSRSFKSHIASLDGMDTVLKNTLLITKMPKFIWCAEFYTKKGYKSSEKEAIGLVILDATEANNQSLDAIIFMGYPDRCMVVNENNFVTLQHKFSNYRYYSNLK
jgi:hypothetical protein